METIVQKILEFLESYNRALNQVQGPFQCRSNATAQISGHKGSPCFDIFQLLLSPVLCHQFLPPVCTSSVQTSESLGVLFLFPCIKWIYIFTGYFSQKTKIVFTFWEPLGLIQFGKNFSNTIIRQKNPSIPCEYTGVEQTSDMRFTRFT